MASFDAEIAIVGAGAAGVATLIDLEAAGRDVICLEARDRIGGRVHTIDDPLSPLPIELGAEFIHGRPPEIWTLARAAALGVYDVTGEAVQLKGGKVSGRSETWELVGHILDEMRAAAATGIDEPFSAFLERSQQAAEAKTLAASYVEGFNAADQRIVGIASLAKDAEAADQIDGDNAFRISSGYHAVLRALLGRRASPARALRLNSVLEGVEWREGSVALTVRSALTGEREIIRASKVVLTLPLGVLQLEPCQEGSIRWDPEPGGMLQAARSLAFGHVCRVVLRFAEPFWEADPEFAGAGFLLSEEPVFPTWWTTLAVRSPILTGWSAGPHAEPLANKARPQILSGALGALARITGVNIASLRSILQRAYFHDWRSDPFARGAYSYVPSGRLAARERLAAPIAGTLYFAGEATELDGHSATVHGAIASGRRAARQIIERA